MQNKRMNNETMERLGTALWGMSEMLTPRQKDIAELISIGCSQKETAERLHIKNAETVNEHLARIRTVCLEYFTENAPDLLYIIENSEDKDLFEQIVRAANFL